jgi:hypothetical protein
MKIRNYEKKSLVLFLIVFTIILELFILIYLCLNKEYKYQILSGIVVKKDLILLVVSFDEKNLLYENSNVYLNDKIVSYKIEENRGIVLNKNNKDYYEILLKVKFSNKYKVNDSIDLVIKSRKIRIIEIFKIMWESD